MQNEVKAGKELDEGKVEHFKGCVQSPAAAPCQKRASSSCFKRDLPLARAKPVTLLGPVGEQIERRENKTAVLQQLGEE